MNPRNDSSGHTSDAPGPTGLLVIDKATGFTSMDVCAIVRGRLRRGGAPKRVKVGHGGTLDPLATGVLVVLIGKATRLCDTIMAGEKEYEATVDLSRTSNTDDAEGDVQTAAVTHVPGRADVERAAAGFVGRIMQRPPAFSALNIGGRRAYQIAREGGRVELDPRPVVVHRLTVIDYQWPLVKIVVVCGKGTYIRSLARDLGAAFGAGGMLTMLRRTRVGSFGIERAVKVDELPDVLVETDLIPVPTSAAG